MSSEKTLIDLALSQPQSAIEALAYDASSRGAITAESVKSKESSYLQTSRGTINSLLSKLTWIVVLGARVVSVPAIT